MWFQMKCSSALADWCSNGREAWSVGVGRRISQELPSKACCARKCNESGSVSATAAKLKVAIGPHHAPTTIEELAATPFDGHVNALWLPRALPGDFAQVVRLLLPGPGITELSERILKSLPVDNNGRIAIDVMLQDLHALTSLGLEPVLNCVNGYDMEPQPGPVRTDVMSFHVDSAPVEVDSWLCTYYGPATEGVGHEHAMRHVDVPTTRASILAHYGGSDDDDFKVHLRERHYDRHYATTADAQLFSFEVGHLWRIAVDWPGSSVLPCIHRAPSALGPRLLLIC
jgi:hypothetical protein